MLTTSAAAVFSCVFVLRTSGAWWFVSVSVTGSRLLPSSHVFKWLPAFMTLPMKHLERATLRWWSSPNIVWQVGDQQTYWLSVALFPMTGFLLQNRRACSHQNHRQGKAEQGRSWSAEQWNQTVVHTVRAGTPQRGEAVPMHRYSYQIISSHG